MNMFKRKRKVETNEIEKNLFDPMYEVDGSKVSFDTKIPLPSTHRVEVNAVYDVVTMSYTFNAVQAHAYHDIDKMLIRGTADRGEPLRLRNPHLSDNNHDRADEEQRVVLVLKSIEITPRNPHLAGKFVDDKIKLLGKTLHHAKANKEFLLYDTFVQWTQPIRAEEATRIMEAWSLLTTIQILEETSRLHAVTSKKDMIALVANEKLIQRFLTTATRQRYRVALYENIHAHHAQEVPVA